LLAQANSHTSGGNRAFLQQQLEQIFLQNQREEELQRQLQQQAATLQQQQQQQQFQLQFQRAAIDSNGTQHLRSPSQASPAQLSSPASMSSSAFSERTTSEAVVQAAALASSAPSISSQRQVCSSQQQASPHQQQQQQQSHSFAVASPVRSVLLASPPSANAHAAASPAIPSRLCVNGISYAPSISLRPAGSSLSTLRHNKGGPFECDACGKTFTQRGQQHKRNLLLNEAMSVGAMAQIRRLFVDFFRRTAKSSAHSCK
jgi:hypothetical protein